MSTPYGPSDTAPPPDSTPKPEQPTIIVPAEPTSDERPTAEQHYYRPSVPDSNQMIMRPTSRTHALIRGGLAVFLLIAAVVNVFWATRFPSNAPVEGIYAFGLTIDLFAAAVVLGVFAILAAARRSVPVKPKSVSPMAVTAFAMSLAVFVIWLLFSLLPVLATLGQTGSYQYMGLVGAIVILGIPWVLGMVFGTLSLRSGGRLTAVFATIAIVLGVLLVVVAVGAAVIYGLGLSR